MTVDVTTEVNVMFGVETLFGTAIAGYCTVFVLLYLNSLIALEATT